MLYVKIKRAWPQFVRSIRPLLAAAMLLALPGMTHAQLSPGKLSKAHASLEGPLQCGNCHAFGAGEPTLDACTATRKLDWVSLSAGATT